MDVTRESFDSCVVLLTPESRSSMNPAHISLLIGRRLPLTFNGGKVSPVSAVIACAPHAIQGIGDVPAPTPEVVPVGFGDGVDAIADGTTSKSPRCRLRHSCATSSPGKLLSRPRHNTTLRQAISSSSLGNGASLGHALQHFSPACRAALRSALPLGPTNPRDSLVSSSPPISPHATSRVRLVSGSGGMKWTVRPSANQQPSQAGGKVISFQAPSSCVRAPLQTGCYECTVPLGQAQLAGEGASTPLP